MKLTIDMDETDQTARFWCGSTVVGEMRPNLRATPAGEIDDARWTGWLSSLAMIELVGSYNAETKLRDGAEPGSHS